VDVGERLRLDPLGGIDDEDRALARLEALMVMPFSRSRSIESRTWLVICRASIVCVISSRRSASVDLP
jgi:hypothetical protein